MPIDLAHDNEAFKEEVLSDQADDDQGVYEVWWRGNTRFPRLPLSARLALAERVVADLLSERRVTLVRGKWIGPEHEREAVADAQAALSASGRPGYRSRINQWCGWLPPDARSSARPH